MNAIYLESIGVFGPGLVGWDQARAVLAGKTPYTPTPLPPLKPERLAPDVRRRTTDHIRLAIEVAAEATRGLGDDAETLPSIFASADSDGAILHDICLEVVKDNPQVSPTRFHNSVNNAPAGYWCMATGSRAPSTSVAGYDGSFTVGLLEACLQLLTETPRVLLVAHDTPMPEPLYRVRPLVGMFGVAFVLTRDRSAHSLARLDLVLTTPRNETTLDDDKLENLRRGNPAARALPLLAALAAKRSAEIHLPYLIGQGLKARIEPLT
jgi:hypothetical protein